MSNKLKKSFETTQANKCKRFYKQNPTTVMGRGRGHSPPSQPLRKTYFFSMTFCTVFPLHLLLTMYVMAPQQLQLSIPIIYDLLLWTYLLIPNKPFITLNKIN